LDPGAAHISITCNPSLNWEVVRWWYEYVLGDGVQHQGKVGAACSLPLVEINSPRAMLINCIRKQKRGLTNNFSLKHQKGMEFFKFRRFSEYFLGYVELPSKPLRIPREYQHGCCEKLRQLPWYLYRRWYQLILEDSITQGRNVNVLYGCV
jgi:hypothetical protein